MPDRATGDATPGGTTRAAFAGTAVNVVDVERAVAFYADVLGFVERERWEFDREPVNIVGVRLQAAGEPDGPSLILATGLLGAGTPTVDTFGRLMFEVSDVDAVCERVRQLGGTVDLNASARDNDTVITRVRDPKGVKWELRGSLDVAGP